MTIQSNNLQSHYCYALCTAGDDIGMTMEYLNKDLAEKELCTHSTFSLKMPESYVGLPFMDVDPKEKEIEKKREAIKNDPVRHQKMLDAYKRYHASEKGKVKQKEWESNRVYTEEQREHRRQYAKKYYKENDISPSMSIVLSQIFHYNLNSFIKNLYYKGKGYELLSLYFNRSEDPNAEQCPFLIDEENVLKIKKAKEIIIANMAEPPTLEVLSEQVGLSLKKLKMGFKQIYGDTVYGFLFDYKMDYARQLLDSGSYNVNEVGLKIGYSTGSHFIAAFKKKFGTTPKKYLMNLNANIE
jgi:AraC-like DNA-binding protein